MSVINAEITEAICQGLMAGQSLIQICKKADMPSQSTIYAHMAKNEEFRSIIAGAREAQADYFLDKQIELAKSATIDDWQLKKFQADNLKWVASKLAPKKYGDKTQVDLNTTVDINALIISAASRGLEILKGDKPDSMKVIENEKPETFENLI